ncbi:hypothetical protein D3C76_943330 [compost metagenome]
MAEHFAFEPASTVRRFAVAKGTDHEQRTFGLVEIVLGQFGQWPNLNRHAGCLQLTGALPGQLLGKTALAGETHQPTVALIGRSCQGAACCLHLAFFTAAIQV